MTTTGCRVSFGQNAIEIRDDATFSIFTGALQSFNDFDDIILGRRVSKPYITYEPDYWLLDGNYRFMPETKANAGIMGNTLSTSPDGNFGTVIDLTIDFDVVHSTSGLKFYFSNSGDYMDTITVKFYDSSIILIQDDTYNPTSDTFSTGQAVTDFKRIHIHLNSTKKAYRYPRIMGIDFDTVTQFSGTDIKAAIVVEQINPLSIELPINTFEMDLFSTVGDFSIVSPAGFYADLQYKEPLDVYESVSGLYVGRFYLDKWNSKSANEAHFEASDALGLLEKNNSLGYYWLDEIAENALGTVIQNSIPSGVPTGIPWEIDDALKNKRVDGLLDMMSCREAVQKICLAIGAYATCSRSNVIRIKSTELASDLVSYDFTLTQAEKGIASPLNLRTLITGVEITGHDFINDDSLSGEILFDGDLAIGTYTMTFTVLVADYDTTGSTASFDITTFLPSVAVVNVTVAGHVTLIRTVGISDAQKIYNRYVLSLPTNTPPNIISISDVLFISHFVGNEVVQRVYDYYQQRYLQKTRLFASQIAPGDSVLVDVQSSRQLKGIVERMETDLAGGFVSKVDIVGVII